MSDDEKFFVSSLPNGKNRKIKINYNFKDNCFLDESQLYVYRDEKLNRITVASLMPKNKIQYRSSTMLNPNIAYGPNNKLNISKAENSK